MTGVACGACGRGVGSVRLGARNTGAGTFTLLAVAGKSGAKGAVAAAALVRPLRVGINVGATAFEGRDAARAVRLGARDGCEAAELSRATDERLAMCVIVGYRGSRG